MARDVCATSKTSSISSTVSSSANARSSGEPWVSRTASLAVVINSSPLVPASAVRVVSGTSRVFVIASDRAEERIVTTGQTVDQLVEITSGLARGEQVATASVPQLVDGVKIR